MHIFFVPFLFEQRANSFQKLFDGKERPVPRHRIAEALQRDGVIERIADNGAQALEVNVANELEVQARLLQERLFELFVRHFAQLNAFPQFLTNAMTRRIRATLCVRNTQRMK